MIEIEIEHRSGPRMGTIEHSLPSTGGASGSPIVNARGEVVAILSGGNIIPSEVCPQQPNAAQVNFAQRIDVLTHLLDPSTMPGLDGLRAG
jgi:hypothetical protein